MVAPFGRVRIAVNTMRARLTILGFNLAIITFQITTLSNREGGVVVAGLDHPLHIPASVALYFAMLLSIAAMVLFIASNMMDEQGIVDHWSMLVGDILMYLGLAHTIMGSFQPLFFDLALPHFAKADDAEAFKILRNALAFTAMIAWMLAAYVGPTVSLLRSPFRLPYTLTIGGGYLVLLFTSAYLWSTANALQASLKGDPETETTLFHDFFVPLHWMAP